MFFGSVCCLSDSSALLLEGDKKNSHVDHASIYDRPGSTYEFQKFAFRGHKKRYEDTVKVRSCTHTRMCMRHAHEYVQAEKCDACAQMITSGVMVTAGTSGRVCATFVFCTFVCL